MGPRHSREALLDAALEVARADGLSRLTFGRVARRAGTSDRVVVYYFHDAAALVVAVLDAVGSELQEVLGRAFDGPATDHVDLLRVAWPVVTAPSAEPVFRLLLEAVGLAVSGREPFAGLAGALTQGWVDWLAGLLQGEPARRRAEAAAAVALLDGMVLLRLLAGPESADAAAAALGLDDHRV